MLIFALKPRRNLARFLVTTVATLLILKRWSGYSLVAIMIRRYIQPPITALVCTAGGDAFVLALPEDGEPHREALVVRGCSNVGLCILCITPPILHNATAG